MTAFEFIIVFLSFAYALAFSHVLFAAARMIRHRRELIFSWPHALWMADAVMLLFSNWISLYDFRAMQVMSIGTILTLFAFVTTLYFTCALVTPDFEDGDYDMMCSPPHSVSSSGRGSTVEIVSPVARGSRFTIGRPLVLGPPSGSFHTFIR